MYGLHKEECEMAPKPKFKVGQRVRVRLEGRNGSGHGASVGEEFVIHSIESNDAVFVGEWFLWPGEFEPIFSNSDRVRVTACNSYFAAGDEGVVEYTDTHHVFVKRGEYQRRGLPIEASKLEWLGSSTGTFTPECCSPVQSAPDCADRKGEQSKPTPKFKVGDVVRSKLFPGVTHTIAGVKTQYSQGVPFCGGMAYDYADTIGWDYEESIELVSPPDEQPCIVALINSAGKPRPSQWPHVHPDSASATAEAERLARNNPGTEFAVYQRVTGRVAEQHIEMKEVA